VSARLYLLSFDDPTSLMASSFGVEGTPTDADADRARAAQLVTAEGLHHALREGAPAAAVAALIDPTYGLDAIASMREAGIRVALPLEVSGRDELELNRRDWKGLLVELDPAWAAVLIRYNPDGDERARRAQRSKLREVAQRCRDTGRGFMLELLVPPIAAQLDAVGGDRERYDTEVRPTLVARAIEEIRKDEIGPNVWALEGLERTEDCTVVAESAGSPCIVVARTDDGEAADRWLRAAAPASGFIGFTIGASIWREPLRVFLHDGASREVTSEAIGAAYRRCVDASETAAS